jgi:hypothetical protein
MPHFTDKRKKTFVASEIDLHPEIPVKGSFKHMKSVDLEKGHTESLTLPEN